MPFNLARLIATDLLIPETGMEKEFRDALHHLEQQLPVRELEQLLEKAEHTVLSEDEKRRLKTLLDHRQEDTP